MMKEKRRPLVIYHANCADGFGAAWCYRKRFGESVDFHPGVYSEAPPDVTGREVLLVDFSYKRDVVEEMLTKAESVTLVDHHKTAIEDLAGLPGLSQYVSLDRSGAMLAWTHCFGSEPPPLLLGHIQDRDLWKFKLAGTREISAFVFSHEYTFEQWDKLMSADQVELLQMTAAGAAIERKHHKDIAELLKVCQRRMVIAGHDVPAASLPYTMGSDAGHIMAKGEKFSACYWDTSEHRIFGLRSSEEGSDVALVAQFYGGGGHKHAAGFRVVRDHELAKC
jgi:uncharacterized protein